MTDSADILSIMLVVVAGSGAFVSLVIMFWDMPDPNDRGWWRLSITTALLLAADFTGFHYFAGA
tara:strand:+ start:376 stop:567 length:192 start_codon:yes stop_codon:yes gene_type:complete